MYNMKRYYNILLWKFYYRYKCLNDTDETGEYSFAQKVLLFMNITIVNIFGEYLTPERAQENIEKSLGGVSDIIYKALTNDKPCMIARYGANEQRIVANYLSIVNPHKNVFNSIIGRKPFWWWNKMLCKELKSNAGFFPNDTSHVEKFSRLMLEDTKQLDVLLTWFGWEPLIIGGGASIYLVSLYEAEPWWQSNPWTRCLRGKRVLVIHPFAELIESQYKRRLFLFQNKDILPEFDLVTIKAVQSIAGECDNFSNWFEALDWMKSEMDKVDYDIALIGCGAYGFCLAAHAKRHGRKAFHMGGVLQLLFGIKGNRWEDKNYHPIYDYTSLFNEYWVKPGDEYKPKGAKNVENECYW